MIERLQLIFRLGITNVIRVVIYKILLKLRLHPVIYIQQHQLKLGPLFCTDVDAQGLDNAGTAKLRFKYFGYHDLAAPISLEHLPDWFSNPIQQRKFIQGSKNWWEINDFNADIGDIKVYWELSRFSFVIPLIRATLEGKAGALTLLNRLTNDWIEKNPPFKGIHWKCGQETSFRVLHAAAGIYLLGEKTRIEPTMQQFLECHLARVFPTTSYAIGQGNNHGTSEAAALYVGGTLLSHLTASKKAQYGGYAAKGRQLLENRVAYLILEDGGFSQYSTVYHRLMLDTLSFVELWRQFMGDVSFSDDYLRSLKKATTWLTSLTDIESGAAPLIGANDGSHILNFSGADYLDFRPSTFLAQHLFIGVCRGYPRTSLVDLASLLRIFPNWENIDKNTEQTLVYPQTGLAVISQGEARIFYRFPSFRFRPSQADLMHIDLWLNGKNVLHDAGTFSYNPTDAKLLNYFSSAEAHNTITFDDLEQMPKLSRFLYSRWPTSIGNQKIEKYHDTLSFLRSYTHFSGAEHSRQIEVQNRQLKVYDRISKFDRHAILRWHLFPEEWTLTNNLLSNGSITIKIESNESLDIQMEEAYRSEYYLEMQSTPVVEARVLKPCTITTTVSW